MLLDPRLTVGGRGGLHKPRKGVENPPDLARMFESVSGVPSFRLVTHQLCQSQCSENIAGPRDAAADGFRNFAGAHLFSVRQQGNNGKRNGIAEKPAPSRLSAVRSSTAAMLVTFSQLRKHGKSQ